jgi:nucleotide-binding universal stress UspA family protein
MGALVFSASLLQAEEITKSDGQVLNSPTIRRVGNSLFVKVTVESGGSVEMGIPISQITKVAFVEPPELAKATEAAASGNAAQVLALTGDFVAAQSDFKDLPGSWWLKMAKLRLLALAATGKDADTAALAVQIGALNSPETDSLARGGALFGPLAASDIQAVITGAKPLAHPGGDAGSALAELALGRALLLTKDYPASIRAFLTIRVFYPSLALLQPVALMGAANAYVGLNDPNREMLTLKEIEKRFPGSMQSAEAANKEKQVSKP